MSVNHEAVHISSLVVHCLPEQLSKVQREVEGLDNVEVCVSDPKGKFVAVLETESEKEILSTITEIQAIDSVLNASMIYHEIDDE